MRDTVSKADRSFKPALGDAIAAEWRCIGCRKRFRYAPVSGELPYAIQTVVENGERVISGPLCRKCGKVKKINA